MAYGYSWQRLIDRADSLHVWRITAINKLSGLGWTVYLWRTACSLAGWGSSDPSASYWFLRQAEIAGRTQSGVMVILVFGKFLVNTKEMTFKDTRARATHSLIFAFILLAWLPGDLVTLNRRLLSLGLRFPLDQWFSTFPMFVTL